MKQISIIVPTYNEAINLPLFFEEVYAMIDKKRFDVEFIVVDDNSPDKTWEVAEKLSSRYPIKVIRRLGKFGLGSAVREGFFVSKRNILGVMDADLSHDPAILNTLLESLEEHDLVIGSRFVEGSEVENWKFFRRLTSMVGVWFTKKITGVKDPLTGYFFFHRSIIDNVDLTTIGYKILFEILVKGQYKKVKEIGFKFRDRKFSTSKLNYKEYFLFAGQIVKYYIYKLSKIISRNYTCSKMWSALKIFNRGVIILGILCILLLTRYDTASWNDASRFATIEKVVSEHTLSIDKSIFWTGDKIQVDNKFYSDKPPVFSIFASIPYFILYTVFDIPFSYHPKKIVYITNVFSLLPLFLLYFYLSYYFAKRYVKYDKEKLLSIIILLSISTVLFSYTTQLNNHLPAAMLVGIASLILFYKKKYSNKDVFFVALLLSFATVFDLGAGFIALSSVFLVGWNVLKNIKDVPSQIKNIAWYAMGACIPALLHVLINIQITGDIWPGSMHPEFFNWEGSEFTVDNLTSASLAVDSFWDWLKYLWFMVLFGYRGLFLHSPILIIGIVLAIYNIVKGKVIQHKIYALSTISSFFSIILYYSLFGKGGGGTSYTIRWFLVFIPLFFPFIINWVKKSKKRFIYLVLFSCIPVFWHMAAMGNVMGSAHHLYQEYSLINAFSIFPEYFLLRIHSLVY
jgi:glycosyltransferase involved in cell wall biosynthesis